MFGDTFEADPAEQEEVDPSAEDVDENQTWTVISSFFNEKGLVRQQLDSFNEFVGNTIQEIVDETPEIVIKPEAQYVPGEPLLKMQLEATACVDWGPQGQDTGGFEIGQGIGSVEIGQGTRHSSSLKRA